MTRPDPRRSVLLGELESLQHRLDQLISRVSAWRDEAHNATDRSAFRKVGRYLEDAETRITAALERCKIHD